MVRQSLKLTIYSAANLRAADTSLFGGSKSDPYIKGYIAGRGHSNFKTRIISKSLDPVWSDEVHILPAAYPGDQLKLFVYGRDVVGTDTCLGHTTLEWEDICKNYEGTVLLKDAGKSHEGKASITLKVECQAVPELRFDPERPYCEVTIVGARDLPIVETLNEPLYPYASCMVPGKRLSTWKTKTADATREPRWNETDAMRGFEENDDLEFTVYHYEGGGEKNAMQHNMQKDKSTTLGTVLLKNSTFYKGDSEQYVLQLNVDSKLDSKAPVGSKSPKIIVGIKIVQPDMPELKLEDPGAHVGMGERWPVPFALRSLDTGRVHQLIACTKVGRSRKLLDPMLDLILDGPGTHDISREHALIKVWREMDSNMWRLRVYSTDGHGQDHVVGFGNGPGGGHAGGGTCIHASGIGAEIVDSDTGTEIEPGDILRFGVTELWVLEKASLFGRSHHGAKAILKANANQTANLSLVRNLRVPRAACLNALKGCKEWVDFVSVALEWLGESDEVPCVELIEVQDELCQTLSLHMAHTVEEQQAYNMNLILKDIAIGSNIRLNLSSDPELLAPILLFLEERRLKVETQHRKWSTSD